MSEKSKDQTPERAGSGFNTRRRELERRDFDCLGRVLGGEGSSRKEHGQRLGTTLPWVLREAPQGPCPRAQAGGQLDSVRLIIVAGSSRLMPRDAKREGTGKGQKLQSLGHVLLWESRLPFQCEKYPSIAVVLLTSVEMVLENTDLN